MPVILLMEHSKRAFEKIESTEGSPGLGAAWMASSGTHFIEDGTSIELTLVPSSDKQCYNVLN